MVENASLKKAPTERFITRFARYYTGGCGCGTSSCAHPVFFFAQALRYGCIGALIFCCLVSLCFSSVDSAGVLCRDQDGKCTWNFDQGGSDLEMLASIETIAFDKTGTLTEGRFALQEILAEPGIDADDMLEMAAYAESLSSHPIAQSLVKAYGKVIDHTRLGSMREFSGSGVHAEVGGREVRVGKSGFVGADDNLPGIHVSVDAEYWGSFVVEDAIKKSAASTIDKLKKMGREILLLSGDASVHVEQVADALGIEKFYGGLLPDEKVRHIEEIARMKKVLFVGDGINDAPVLAASDVGVAMGGVGSDAALEAADIVLISDEIDKLPKAIEISHRTKRILFQNIIFAIGVKVLVMILGAAGIANMWLAVFADVGVALLAVLNSLRVFFDRSA